MTNTQDEYVHGYARAESERLIAQAGSVEALLHGDTAYPAGSRVLEVGCGTGAQTVTLARNSPGARIVAVDRSTASLAQAAARIAAAGLGNVEFHCADIYALPFAARSFDHVFVCFVLEHLPLVERALALLRELLEPGGTITVFEGDHGSTYFHPHSEAAVRSIQSLVELQRRAGGNALVGRELYPLLTRAGLEDVHVTPQMVYVDASRPGLVEAFTRNTFIAMIQGVREPVIATGLLPALEFDAGIADLVRTTEADGVFCYTFFKGVARRPSATGRASSRRSG